MARSAKSGNPRNLVPNGTFERGRIGQLPDSWELKSPYEFLKPSFKLARRGGRRALLAAGAGNANCAGWIQTPLEVRGGKTYRMRVSFEMTPDVNPHRHLLFALYGEGFNNGVFRYRRAGKGKAVGEGRFLVPGKGRIAATARIYFHLSAEGKVWVREIALEECDPIPPRWVRVACTKGAGDLKKWAKVLDAAGRAKADLALLPETFKSEHKPEPTNGPSAQLMASKARQYGMVVSGTFQHKDPKAGLVFNSAMLYDRKGRRIGRYDKNHPYSPEWLHEGVSPGNEVEVFQTDFGKVGIIICYDSWFTDVTELLALKGAEIVLFPNAGYCRGLMPARAADNCVRFAVSSLGTEIGVWDTSGAEVAAPDADPTRCAGPEKTFRNVKTKMVDDVKILFADLDFSKSPSPHNWGGPMLSAPGGRRNRREQNRLLYREIEREVERWWED
ncbi:MAG TPA: carbon-nitrogen hydrolase family protein [Sumerlaeia bacterium]|nr:carbon-nitrogen hydrolase family protein [Sumerlaeia bacterium]